MAKLTDEKLTKLIQDGQQPADIARQFKITKSAVSQRMKKLGLKIASHGDWRTKALLQENLDAAKQIKEINYATNTIIDRLIGSKGEESTVLKACNEIRSQLELQLKIFESLYTMRAVQEFQRVVLDAIAKVDPDTRDRIIREIRLRRMLPESFKGFGPAGK